MPGTSQRSRMRRSASRGSVARTGGRKASGAGRTRRRRRTSEPKWVPPPNARSIWHEPGSREDIQQQMAILAWRRAEIDARMKSVIAGTKVMQEQDMMVGLAADRTAERARWMQGVIREELNRPIYFDKMAMLELEEKAEREAQAARRQVENHGKLLDTMRFNVLRRDPAFVKAQLNSTASAADNGRSLIGTPSNTTVSLPALGSSSNLGTESRQQLEQLDSMGRVIAENRKALRSKKDIVKSVTRKANTHTKKKRPGAKPRRRARSKGTKRSGKGPQDSRTPESESGGLRLGASAVSPTQS